MIITIRSWVTLTTAAAALTKDEAEELQELSQGKSATGQARDNSPDDVSTNVLVSKGLRCRGDQDRDPLHQ